MGLEHLVIQSFKTLVQQRGPLYYWETERAQKMLTSSLTEFFVTPDVQGTLTKIRLKPFMFSNLAAPILDRRKSIHCGAALPLQFIDFFVLKCFMNCDTCNDLESHGNKVLERS